MRPSIMLSLTILVVLLTACRSEIDEAEAAVSAMLRDPSSAQFRNVRRVKDTTNMTGVYAVCGEVNGKNGMGGYAGFRPFMYRDGVTVIGATDDPALATVQRLYFDACQKLPPTTLTDEERESFEMFLGD